MPVYVNQIFFYHYVFIVGQVDLKVGQVNFAELLARGQVLQKCICQLLWWHTSALNMQDHS